MTEMNGYHRKKSEFLADQGFKYIREGEYETALEIAEKLEELRYTAAFDIAAQAYAGLGDIEKAVEALERGLKKAPECWLNWQLLGNYHSDMEDYDKAEKAYARAIDCPEVWEDSIRLNQAILSSRLGEHERSLIILNKVQDDNLSLEVTETKITALHAMGRLDEALSLADACLNEHSEVKDAGETLGHIAAKKWRIRFEQGLGPEEVRRSVMEGLEEFGSHTDLLTLIRDIDHRYCANAKYYRLLIHATISEWDSMSNEASGYFITYDVVAESPEEALRWVQEFEDADSQSATLSIEESEVLEERPGDPIGVYCRTGRIYHGDDDDE